MSAMRIQFWHLLYVEEYLALKMCHCSGAKRIGPGVFRKVSCNVRIYQLAKGKKFKIFLENILHMGV